MLLGMLPVFRRNTMISTISNFQEKNRFGANWILKNYKMKMRALALWW
jgi:hypothetical protein